MTSKRAGASTNRQARSRTWAVLKRPRIALISIAATVLLVLLELGILIGTKAAGLHVSSQVTAFVLGATVASVLWALWTVGLTMGGGSTWAAGAAMEELTGQLLEHLGRDWVVFHNVPFLDGTGRQTHTVDVDHIAVGPSGVLVVETKYTFNALDISLATQFQQRRAIRQVRDNAGRVTALLRRAAPDLRITPVVVWWGPNLKRTAEVIRQAGDVLVVRGVDSREWLTSMAFRATETVESSQRAVVRIEGYLNEQIGDGHQTS